jgi:MoaA/NifB/PqqE/SkfB family radical SAM enzyme
MAMRKLKGYLRLGANYARMSYTARRGDRPIYWPLITSLYLNHRCNLSCSYCDDGTGTKYPDAPATELGTHDVLRILSLMRTVNSVMSFTGGEPTLRRDFPEIVRTAKGLGFLTHVNTNGTVWKTLSEALPHLDAVSVSLDTLDCERSDRVFGVGDGQTRRVLENLSRLRDLRRRGERFGVVVNTVIHAGNVEDVYPLLDYCWENGFGFAPLPHVAGYYPSPGLEGNPSYRALFSHLIALKRRGYPIEGTLECLEGLRDFQKYECAPMMIARIQPDGTLYFPCNMLHTYGANLLTVSSFAEAVEVGLARNGYAPPSCDNRCHMSCYMDFSLIAQSPWIALRDGAYRALGAWKRLAARATGRTAFPPVPRPPTEAGAGRRPSALPIL